MANSAQARKRARQSVKVNLHNAALRSTMRTAMKKIIKAIESGYKAAAAAAYHDGDASATTSCSNDDDAEATPPATNGDDSWSADHSACYKWKPLTYRAHPWHDVPGEVHGWLWGTIRFTFA